MGNVERFPHIDPSVKHVGVSKLRALNAEKLRDSDDTLVIQDNDKPLAVLLTYDRFLAMQEELAAVVRTVEMLCDKTEMTAFMKAGEDVKANRIRSLAQIDEAYKKNR